MKNNFKKGKQISRRNILPVLGSTFLIPFLGFGNFIIDESTVSKEEYQTLLKPDGTTVKVKSSNLKKSKIIKKDVSNKSFFNWLTRKF